MSNFFFKIISISMFMVFLTFSLNIESEEVTVGVAITEAIPCYSQAKRNLNYAYVDCASCERLTGWRATGGAGSCSGGGEDPV